MPTPPRSGDFSDLHKRQLFHWLGADIDRGLRAKTLPISAARQRYLAYLKDDFKNGLAVKPPRDPEQLLRDGRVISLNLPLACFTEWSLSESRPHSTRYGRMALGFSKPWVIKHGGQPVTYFRNTGRSVFLRTLVALHEFLRELQQTPGPRSPAATRAFRDAFYLLHFAKPLASPAAKRPRRPTPRPAPPSAAPTLAVAKRRAPTRYYGPVLNFLEEREWRIVRHDQPYFAPDPLGKFDSRLKFALGSELFTLVLPDHELVKMVWNDRSLRRQLLAAPVPVTVISFQDIGTF
ncbi:hypothetical protein LBMAG56_27030 [Verrucomicrobiota bacterium]|nr:hypothetical protein LBMAG56_27030 [Verrucomicrobiota bacterium]